MKYTLLFLIGISLSPSIYAGNSYIEFGQFDKVQKVSVAAGVLYACSKNESTDWSDRHAYQFLHFKLDQIVTDYFKLSYRVIAIQEVPLSERVAIVDSHRQVEKQISTWQEQGFDAVKNGQLTCEGAGGFASEIMKYQD